MKKLIDYDQQELEHIVKYNEYYKIISYILFILLIAFMFFWSVEADSVDYYKGIVKIQDSCYINALEQQKLSIDTAHWYKEMGIKFENNLDY